MLKLVLASFCLASSTLALAAGDAAGRWEGLVPVANLPLHVTVDIAPASAGVWIGSITVPELNMSGAALAEVSLHDKAVALTVKDVLVDATAGPAKFQGQLDSANTLSGTFSQGGNAVPFTFKKTGAAQVQVPPHSTAVGKDFEGKWIGDYVFDGNTRHVTLRFANHAGAAATADFVIVGKKENVLPVDFIVEEEGLLQVESHQTGFSFEGRVRKDSGELAGICKQGPYEVSLVLHRASEK